jgi:hypothetical protein
MHRQPVEVRGHTPGPRRREIDSRDGRQEINPIGRPTQLHDLLGCGKCGHVEPDTPETKVPQGSLQTRGISPTGNVGEGTVGVGEKNASEEMRLPVPVAVQLVTGVPVPSDAKVVGCGPAAGLAHWAGCPDPTVRQRQKAAKTT